ncbi:MAG: DUF1127 domain-containing protein [Gammaproteobacteria bacterium]|nr:DUF1127 domain-containing protein [Gammaproteobacteria bacterium]
MISIYFLYDNIENDAMFRNGSIINFTKGVTMLKNLKTWYVRRQAINELSALPDYLLRDLGIENRYQIAEVIDGKLFPLRSKTVSANAVVDKPSVSLDTQGLAITA